MRIGTREAVTLFVTLAQYFSTQAFNNNKMPAQAYARANDNSIYSH